MVQCGCCENPGYRKFNMWALLALSVIAWIFSIVAVADCGFWKLDVDADHGVGIFKIDVGDGSCVKYPSGFDFSTEHKVSRAFGVLCTLCTSFAMVGIILIVFFLKEEKGARIVWIITKVLYGLAIPCTLLMFTMFKDCFDTVSNNDLCVAGAAGIINAVNLFILLGVSIASCCTPLPEEPLVNVQGGCCSGNQYASDTKQVGEQSQMASAVPVGYNDSAAGGSVVKTTVQITDKGRKTTKEIRMPDGSMVVEETIEETA